MQHVELTIPLPDALHEWLIAELTDLDFEGFVEEDETLKAYLPASAWTDVKRMFVEGWLVQQGLDPHFEERVVTEQNWNAAFEATIEPVSAGPFVIRPTWAVPDPEDAGQIEILIDPKMSFGTGHHESTRLVLEMLPHFVAPHARVLDAGTGTGVLAIAALKLGAASALTFDIDPWAEENAGENFALNGVQDMAEVRIGSVEVVPERDFDVVIANIHREVLLALLPDLVARLAAAGTLVLAGLLRTDADAIREAAAQEALSPVRDAAEGAWWAVALQRAA